MTDLQSLPPVLRAPDAARILGVSRSTIYELCRQGRLPHIRLTAHRLIIPRDALMAWLSNCGDCGQASKSLSVVPRLTGSGFQKYAARR